MKPIIFSAIFVPAVLASGTLTVCPNIYDRQQNVKEEQIKCLATMIYGEARSESIEGQIAVAYSAINRAVKKSVCQVVLAPKQYSVFNGNSFLIQVALSSNLFPKQKNKIDEQSWETAVRVATDVLTKKVKDPTNGATHYIADEVMKQRGYVYPRWAFQYTEVATIGNHRFFKPHYPRKV